MIAQIICIFIGAIFGFLAASLRCVAPKANLLKENMEFRNQLSKLLG